MKICMSIYLLGMLVLAGCNPQTADPVMGLSTLPQQATGPGHAQAQAQAQPVQH